MPTTVEEPLEYDLLIVQVCEFLDYGDGIHRFTAPARPSPSCPACA